MDLYTPVLEYWGKLYYKQWTYTPQCALPQSMGQVEWNIAEGNISYLEHSFQMLIDCIVCEKLEISCEYGVSMEKNIFN